MHPINRSRKLHGAYHHSKPDLLKDEEKFVAITVIFVGFVVNDVSGANSNNKFFVVHLDCEMKNWVKYTRLLYTYSLATHDLVTLSR